MISSHTDPNTAGVYLDRAWDRNCAMYVICIDAKTNDPMIYGCAEIYAMKLSVSRMRICFGDGNPSGFYLADDISGVVTNVNTTAQRKDKSDRKRRRFQYKKVEAGSEWSLDSASHDGLRIHSSN